MYKSDLMKGQRPDGVIDDRTFWIWLQHPFELHERYVRFRRSFTLGKQPEKANLSITADSRYRLYVNGKYVAFGPTRGYPHCQCVDQHDIAPRLKKGSNVIAVCVYQPGYSHFSYVHRANAGLLLSLKISGRTVLRSDESWKVSPDDSYASNVPRISIYGAGQEHRDLRLADNWHTLGYDDREWTSPGIAGVMGHSPWDQWQPSPLPPLTERLINARFLAAMTGSLSPRSFENTLNNDPHHVVRSAYASRKLLQNEASDDLPQVKRGQALMLCYNVSHSQVGSAHLRLHRAGGGEQVLVSYLEKGSFGDWVLSDPQTYCHVRMTDQYILAPGQNVLEPFTPRGGRYLLVTIVGPVKKGLKISARFRTRCYPLTLLKKPPKRRDKLSKKIADMCIRSLQSCAQDGIVDSPWREQTLAIGDGAVTGRLAAELFGDARLLRRVIELGMQGTTPDGVMPGMIPTETHRYTVLDFSFAWVEALNGYFHFTKDRKFVDQCWSTLEKLLDRFDRDRGKDGLLRAQPGRRFFLDWADLPRDEPSALYNFKYLYALQQARRLALKTERKSVARRWNSRENKHLAALHETFHRGGTWYDAPRRKDRSQHVATFLVLTGIAQGRVAEQLMDEAVDRSLEVPGNRLILASPYIHYYLFEALNELDRLQDILAIIRMRWGRWLESGAVTTWENWEVDFPDGSQCHAWSAYPLLYL